MPLFYKMSILKENKGDNNKWKVKFELHEKCHHMLNKMFFNLLIKFLNILQMGLGTFFSLFGGNLYKPMSPWKTVYMGLKTQMKLPYIYWVSCVFRPLLISPQKKSANLISTVAFFGDHTHLASPVGIIPFIDKPKQIRSTRLPQFLKD